MPKVPQGRCGPWAAWARRRRSSARKAARRRGPGGTAPATRTAGTHTPTTRSCSASRARSRSTSTAATSSSGRATDWTSSREPNTAQRSDPTGSPASRPRDDLRRVPRRSALLRRARRHRHVRPRAGAGAGPAGSRARDRPVPLPVRWGGGASRALDAGAPDRGGAGNDPLAIPAMEPVRTPPAAPGAAGPRPGPCRVPRSRGPRGGGPAPRGHGPRPRLRGAPPVLPDRRATGLPARPPGHGQTGRRGPHAVEEHGRGSRRPDQGRSRESPRGPAGRLVRAYRRAAAAGLPHTLVLAGPLGWHYQSLLREIRLAGPGEVVLTGRLEPTQLDAVYREASAFVYPSVYEGFGLPVLEAMARGVPTIASTAASLPEVTGDAALGVNPGSVREIAAAIEQVLSDRALADRLGMLGRARSERFSWEETARLTTQAYERALGRKDGGR